MPVCMPEPDEPKLREECGVFGVFGVDEAARQVALGLHALQHRGLEGCGIASFDELEGRFHSRRRRGLVERNFSDPNIHTALPGRCAIGHVRYSTTGGSAERNLQPLFAELNAGGMAVAHNGNFVNGLTLRRDLRDDSHIFHTDSDTEVIFPLVARSRKASVEERFCDALDQIVGGYAILALTGDMMIAARDPIGIRPLVIGRLGGAYVVASETSALGMIGATLVRDVEPGEVIAIRASGLEPVRRGVRARARTCAFEYIYFARPDSVIDGISVHGARRKMGMELAKEHPKDVDLVVAVPDSGIPAGIGYASQLGLPFDQGIIRSHHIGRTFISPGQGSREKKARMKHRANAAVLEGMRVALVDDSIVRGTTSRVIVESVIEAGASEVHFLSASPPIVAPDFYGIDMPTKHELMAANLSDHARMATSLRASSLGFLSIDGLYRAVFDEPRNNAEPQMTDHYFTGDYPTALADFENGLLNTGAGSLLAPEAT